MHNGVDDHMLSLCFPAVVNDEREMREDIAPNLRIFDDAPACRGSDHGGNCGFNLGHKPIRHSW